MSRRKSGGAAGERAMRFTKMQGLGNDYVYLNCLEGTPPALPELARRLGIASRAGGFMFTPLLFCCRAAPRGVGDTLEHARAPALRPVGLHGHSVELAVL